MAKALDLPGTPMSRRYVGLQRLHVKLARGVDNAVRAHGVELQLGVVGRRRHAAAGLRGSIR